MAGRSDYTTVRALDDATFPESSPDKQRAEPGELEWGIEAGDVHLLDYEGHAVGYVYADRSVPGRVYISGIAIHPGFQGHGFGGLLMSHLLTVLPDGDRTAVVTVTSPRNLRMLRTLFRRGFAARWALTDYFGPGKHRFGCQLVRPGRFLPPSSTWCIPIAAFGTLFEMMRTQDLVVRTVTESGLGQAFLATDWQPAEFFQASPP